VVVIGDQRWLDPSQRSRNLHSIKGVRAAVTALSGKLTAAQARSNFPGVLVHLWTPRPRQDSGVRMPTWQPQSKQPHHHYEVI
jgi:hypothetical protein